MPPPFIKRDKSKNGLLVSFDKSFDVIPNGHKDFLTKPALTKVNEWRRRNFSNFKPLISSSHEDEINILPEEVKVDYNYPFDNAFPGENVSIEIPNPQVGAEEEAAAIILKSMSDKSRRKKDYKSDLENENDEDEDIIRNNYRTVDDWINDFNQTTNLQENDNDTDRYWPSFNGKSSKDFFKTALPEVPTVFGDTSDGNIMTMRLKARKGFEINVRKGETIYVRREEPTNQSNSDNFSTALEVVDIIYGEKSYINLLVDGAENNDETTTETSGNRKRNMNSSYYRTSSSTAYVRVIKPKM